MKKLFIRFLKVNDALLPFICNLAMSDLHANGYNHLRGRNTPLVNNMTFSQYLNYLKGEDGNNYMKVYNQVQADKIFNLIKEI